MGFDFSELNKLTAHIENMSKEVKIEAQKIVKTNGARMQSEMTKKAQFGRYAKKPKTRGTLRNSITTSIEDGGLTSITQPHEDYAGYVEYGTRKMRAQPYIKPAFDKVSEEFKKDIENMMK